MSNTIIRIPVALAESIENEPNMVDLRSRNEERLRSLKEDPQLPVQEARITLNEERADLVFPNQQRMTVRELRLFLAYLKEDTDLEVTLTQPIPQFLKRN